MTADDAASGGALEDAAGLAGDRDGFERLWTPHRMVYIGGQDKPADDTAAACPFERVQGLPDAEGLVVHRGETAFVVMNLYPYSPGHVMVCPNRHVSSYVDLTPAETVEVAQLTQAAVRVLTSVSAPHGFNIGMNQGAVAGAGIAAHLHQHVVPRWGGDSNFLPIIAQTKAVPELLSDTRQRLADAWDAASA
ncbi:HIT family protein [Angustibacter aerolatus]